MFHRYKTSKYSYRVVLHVSPEVLRIETCAGDAETAALSSATEEERQCTKLQLQPYFLHWEPFPSFRWRAPAQWWSRRPGCGQLSKAGHRRNGRTTQGSHGNPSRRS